MQYVGFLQGPLVDLQHVHTYTRRQRETDHRYRRRKEAMSRSAFSTSSPASFSGAEWLIQAQILNVVVEYFTAHLG